MVSFRGELHLKCAALSDVKVCVRLSAYSSGCMQYKGGKKMQTNHLVAQLKHSLPLSHTHTLSLISGFQILTPALTWPYFLSVPKPQVLPAPASLCSNPALCHFRLQTCGAFSSSRLPLLDQYLPISPISAQRHFEEVFPKAAFPYT